VIELDINLVIEIIYQFSNQFQSLI